MARERMPRFSNMFAKRRVEVRQAARCAAERLEDRTLFAASITPLGQTVNTNISTRVGQAVHVHGLASTLPSGTEQIEARYEWNFGDVASSTYNNLVGFNAAHIYNTPGTYTLTLKVRDQQGVIQAGDTKTIQVTVAAKYAQNTIYVDSVNGLDTNNGASSTSAIKTITELENRLTTHQADTTVLFSRGKTYNLTNAIDLNYANLNFDAYGSGAKPIIKDNTANNDGTNLFSTGANANKVTIQNLAFDTNSYIHGSPGSYVLGGNNGRVGNFVLSFNAGSNVLIKDCTVLNADSLVVQDAGSAAKGLMIQGCNQEDNLSFRGYLAYVTGDDTVIVGNTVTNSIIEHNIRTGEGASRILIAENELTNQKYGLGIDARKTTLAIRWVDGAYIYKNKISGDQVQLGFRNAMVPTDPGEVDNVVVDSNVINVIATAETDEGIHIEKDVQSAMIRNNVIYHGSESYAIGIDGTSISNIRILHNTSVNSSTDASSTYTRSTFLRVQPSGTSNVTLKNNLAAKSSSAQSYVGVGVTVSGTGTLSGFNSITGNVWANASAVFVEAGSLKNLTYWNGQSVVSPDDMSAGVVINSSYRPPASTVDDDSRVDGAAYDYHGSLRPSSSVTAGAAEDTTTTSPPVVPPVTTPTLAGITLVNAVSDADIGAFTNGQTLDTSGGKQYSVRADPGTGTLGSVVFSVDGVAVQTENFAIFAIAGNDADDYNPWNVPAGNHTLTVTPYTGANGTGTAGTPIVANFFAGTSPPAFSPVKINFQPASAPTVSGYLVDGGNTYGVRNGQTYGWESSHTDSVVDRNVVSNQLLDTNVGVKAGIRWELAVPNGTYTVKVSVGDASVATTNNVWVEGVNLFAHQPQAAGVFDDDSLTVTVSDGKLLLGVGSAATGATRINYIEVSLPGSPPTSPPPTSPPPPVSYEFIQNGNGLVSAEAEHFNSKTDRAGASWSEYSATAGFSGTGAIQATPDNGNATAPGSGPQVDFPVRFNRTGTHYIWVRGLGVGSTGGSDSVNIGLDGTVPETSDHANAFPEGSYGWLSDGNGERLRFEVTTPGLHTVNLFMREDGSVVDKFIITNDVNYSPIGTAEAETPSLVTQTGGGLVALEAENYISSTDRLGYAWERTSTRTGYSGGGAMIVNPDLGGATDPGDGPQLDYLVNFNRAGTHYILVRGLGVGSTGGSDSVHIGIDGSTPSGSDHANALPADDYGWIDSGEGARLQFNVPSAGVHTINVYMREDGTVFDKLILTDDESYSVAGNGPDETR